MRVSSLALLLLLSSCQASRLLQREDVEEKLLAWVNDEHRELTRASGGGGASAGGGFGGGSSGGRFFTGFPGTGTDEDGETVEDETPGSSGRGRGGGVGAGEGGGRLFRPSTPADGNANEGEGSDGTTGVPEGRTRGSGRFSDVGIGGGRPETVPADTDGEDPIDGEPPIEVDPPELIGPPPYYEIDPDDPPAACEEPPCEYGGGPYILPPARILCNEPPCEYTPPPPICDEDTGVCYYIAIGRPYRPDGVVDGESVVAGAFQDTSSDASALAWSAPEPVVELEEAECPVTEEPNNTMSTDALATDWTGRAIGEHASIASFAAFTISLMSNQAPPDLIRDALAAGIDEVNHAVISFEVASQLSGGRPVEPDVLPPSTVHFEKNLTSLALAAAREGCIDETLSALELARQVEKARNMTKSEDGGDEDYYSLSMDLATKTAQIAIDESRHAVLAWRTIHWVCSIDSDACDAVRNQVLHPEALSRTELVTRFTGADNPDGLAKAWATIYQTLVPLVTGDEVDDLEAEREVVSAASSVTMQSLADDIVLGFQRAVSSLPMAATA